MKRSANENEARGEGGDRSERCSGDLKQLSTAMIVALQSECVEGKRREDSEGKAPNAPKSGIPAQEDEADAVTGRPLSLCLTAGSGLSAGVSFTLAVSSYAPFCRAPFSRCEAPVMATGGDLLDAISPSASLEALAEEAERSFRERVVCAWAKSVARFWAAMASMACCSAPALA